MSSYLKRAALSRLNARLVNKKEELACGLRRFTIHVEDLESSTLSDVEKHHVNRWSQGTESGRMCLLALLDHRRALQAISGSDATEEKQGVGEGAAGGGGVEFALLSSSINLPEEFLCNSSYLYQRVFSKPPVAVIREALELLKEKAHEQSIESLDVDQINMALKQIRVDNLAQAAVAWEKADNEESKDADQENRGRGNSEEATPLTHTARVKSRLRRVRDEELRLQIIVELIRQHILATNPVDPICGSPIEVPRLPENIAVAELHSHLAVPLERQEKRALTMPPDALERSNLLLKPYIHQLAALRSTLQAQLRELEENAAFFSLGLDNGCNASDAQIKRAYHTLAVRLHPDKPGGDTAKFQKLQDAYQEVLKKKKEKDAQQAAMKGHLADGGDAAGAQHIVEVVAAGIAVVRQAAAQTTTLAQKNIRLMKDIEAAASTVMVGADGVSNSVHAIKLLQALLTEGAADDGQGDGDGDGDGDDDDDSLSRWLREMDAKEPKLSVDEVDSTTATQDKPPPVKVTPRHDLAALSPKHAAAPLEAICEHLQLIAARSMELPACGSRYASATARSPAFIENVEKCMATGLASLKTSGSLGVADAQVSSSVLRLQFAPLLSKTKKTKTKNKTKTTSEGGSKKSRSKFLYDDSDGSSDGIEDFMLSDSDSEFDEEEEEGESEEEEFRGILIEMVLTAFRSASVTINIAAERAIAAVVTATDLHMALVDIVNNADKDRHDEARRKADVEEAESQFCAEDREMMREMKSKAAAEDKVKNDAARAQAKVEEDKKRKQEDEEDEADPSGMAALGRLKSQIQSLQVQLHLQHVKSLHALNTEARGLQVQLLGRLQSFPTGGGVGDATPQGGSDAGTGGSPRQGKQGTAEASADIVSLVAELVDSSYAELRLVPMSLDESGASDVRQAIHEHLGWMVMAIQPTPEDDDEEEVGGEGGGGGGGGGNQEQGRGDNHQPEAEHKAGNDPLHQSAMPPSPPPAAQASFQHEPELSEAKSAADMPPPPPTTSTSTTPGPGPKPPTLAPTSPPPLALLPDFRTRALLMAFMLRSDAARSLVHEELRERLVALACLVGGSEAAARSRDAAIAEANSFVNDVLAAVDKAKYA